MSYSPKAETVLPADREHGGIQFTIPLIMLLAGALVFMTVDGLLLEPWLGGGDWDSFRPPLRIVLTVVLGVAAGGVAEAIFRRTWPSGRRLGLGATGLTVEEKGQPPRTIAWDRRLNRLTWCYEMRGYPRGGRERRIPTGYWMLACRLIQDDISAVVHTFLPRRALDKMPGRARFIQLEITQLYTSSNPLKFISRPERPQITAALLAGQRGQLWAAEKERWRAGFELAPADFGTLMDALERYAPLPPD